MQTSRILDSVEARLQHHAQVLGLDYIQTDRARSLAIAGTVGALLGVTPAELFSLLAPAFTEWERRQRPTVDTVESSEVH